VENEEKGPVAELGDREELLTWAALLGAIMGALMELWRFGLRVKRLECVGRGVRRAFLLVFVHRTFHAGGSEVGRGDLRHSADDRRHYSLA
jgi:hypothetical protein